MTPPRLATALLARLLPARERDEILGDLREHYCRRARERGRLGAALWYWRGALSVPAHLRLRALRQALPEAGELRYAARGLVATPAFTAVAVLSLSLGIGGNTAIFSALRSLLLSPLAVERPEELTLIYYTAPELRVTNYSSSGGNDPVTGESVSSNLSYPLANVLLEAAPEPVTIALYNFAHEVSLVAGEQPAIAASVALVSGNFFRVLRPGVALGRPLAEADDHPGAPPVAVISHALWQRVFAGDPEVIGRVAVLNGYPFEVVGVTAAGFTGMSRGGFFPPTDVTVPISSQPLAVPRWTPDEGPLTASERIFWVRLLARVPSGTDAGVLRDRLSAALRGGLADRRLVEGTNLEASHVALLPGARGVDDLGRRVRQPLTILTAAVGVVLLIACANLASLLLARGASRQREMAVRRALGASRGRLMRQVLLECLLLAGGGCAVALLVARQGGAALAAALTAGAGRVDLSFDIDGPMLLLTGGLAVTATLLCGVLPALRLSSVDPHGQLRARTDATTSKRFGLGRLLIAFQIAVSVPLLVAAGLFLRTLVNLGAVDTGFDAGGVVVFRVDPATASSEPAAVRAMYERILDNIAAIPAVRSASLMENVLLSGWYSNTSVSIDGEQHALYMNAVAPGYFETLQVPILAGRDLRPDDGFDAPPVALVNRAAAERYFGGSALGKMMRRNEVDVEIVGVVADTKYNDLRGDVLPTFFDPYLQRGELPGAMHVVARVAAPPAALEPAFRDAVARAEPQLPITAYRSQQEQFESATARERVFARLLGLFSGFAMLVACIGLHGVTAFAVARRRSEMGIRLALGARPGQVHWLVLREVLALSALGVAVGLGVSFLVVPVIGSMLYGIEPTNPATLAGAALLLGTTALVAGWLPARRAARTDALSALAQE